ncbi:uncharacterized protein B0T15DRAFT_554980 [Chaetomium strumarium]|uniref:Uncharacterized protein n=1 Tax=Chaetomium strumarium TaxID=1170767 RepID=A0AAJ0GS72_9PEZI|nr:hypothetical protein B0T15DRAFT_554980 [Chaetomium strumarium]
MAPQSKTLLVVGSGPGIGRAVATLFASKEQAALEQAVGQHVTIKTYAVDVTDTDALLKALAEADAAIGKPECVFFNAARVLPSVLLEHSVKDIEYDLKINVSALYTVAQRYIPHLVQLANKASDDKAASNPALIVISSMLPMEPIPQLFVLSLAKAAQRNLVQSLNMTYGSQGVFVGVINVAGPVAPTDAVGNPANIAAKTWEWFEKGTDFEVVI